MSDPQVRVALIIFDDVSCKSSELNKLLQRCTLTPTEGLQFVSTKIFKLHRQNFGGVVFWSNEGCEFKHCNPDIDMTPILKFVEHLCLRLDSRFLENKLADWNIFKFAALRNATSFNFGENQIRSLII